MYVRLWRVILPSNGLIVEQYAAGTRIQIALGSTRYQGKKVASIVVQKPLLVPLKDAVGF